MEGRRSGFFKEIGSLNKKIIFSTLEPKSPEKFELWIDLNTLNIYFYYNDEWIQLTNSLFIEAGENLYTGEVAYISQSDGKAYKNPVDGTMKIGVVLNNVSTGNNVCIIYKGIAYVLPDSSLSLNEGYLIYSSSTTAGRVQQSSSTSGISSFVVCGKALEDSSGNGVLTKCVIDC